MNAVLVKILCLAGSPERCEAIRPAEWPPQVSLLECGVFGQHFASDWLRLRRVPAPLVALRDRRANMTAEKCLADPSNEGKSEICQAQSRDSAAMAR